MACHSSPQLFSSIYDRYIPHSCFHPAWDPSCPSVSCCSHPLPPLPYLCPSLLSVRSSDLRVCSVRQNRFRNPSNTSSHGTSQASVPSRSILLFVPPPRSVMSTVYPVPARSMMSTVYPVPRSVQLYCPLSVVVMSAAEMVSPSPPE